MKRSESFWAQVVYYLGWIAMVFGETALWAFTGLIVGLVVFFVGGLIWAKYEVDHIREGEVLRGPILVLIDWLLRLQPTLLLPVATLVGGSPGVGLVLKKQGSPRLWRLTTSAALLYAVFWGILNLLRPEAGVSFGLWPDPNPFVWLRQHRPW